MVARFESTWTTHAEMRAEKASTSLRREIGSFVSSRIESCTRSCPRMRTAGPLPFGSWALEMMRSARRIGRGPGSGRRTFRLAKFCFCVFNVNILVRLQGLQAAAARTPWISSARCSTRPACALRPPDVYCVGRATSPRRSAFLSPTATRRRLVCSSPGSPSSSRSASRRAIRRRGGAPKAG